jgi:hypothetical protein
MSLSYRTRRRLSLLILVIGVPAYIVCAVSLIALLDRPSFLTELGIYVGLGFLWILPLRRCSAASGGHRPRARTARPRLQARYRRDT